MAELLDVMFVIKMIWHGDGEVGIVEMAVGPASRASSPAVFDQKVVPWNVKGNRFTGSSMIVGSF